MQNSTQGFVQTYGVGVCRGRYAPALIREWRAWDKRNGSENDPVDVFGPEQLFVVFVVANGGADLEHFEVHSYEEARSIILQVRQTALSVKLPCLHLIQGSVCCGHVISMVLQKPQHRLYTVDSVSHVMCCTKQTGLTVALGTLHSSKVCLGDSAQKEPSSGIAPAGKPGCLGYWNVDRNR